MAEFRQKAEAAGLKKDTITRLLKDDIDSEEVVAMLSDADIKALLFSTGQTILLRRWVKTLSTGEDDTASSQTGEKEELSDLLADVDTSLPSTSSKPLFPCDFLGGSPYPDRDTTVCSQGASRLILKSGRNQLLPEQLLSLAQWVSANARIMHKFVREGSLSSTEEMCNYLEYVESIGNYAQVNTIKSVMSYDHEYRRKQFEKNRPWDAEDFHLANFLLHKKEPVADYRSRVGRQGPQSANVEICRNYNSQQGCMRDNCRYIHVCIVCRKPGHTGVSHRNTQPLDPKAGAFVPSLSNSAYRR